MSKVKEIYVEAKKSKNFQTYTMGITVTVPETYTEEQIVDLRRRTQKSCRSAVMEQIELDTRG